MLTPLQRSLTSSLLDNPPGDTSLNRCRHSVYIDDLNLYGTDPLLLNQLLDEYLPVMAAAGLPAKPSKIVRPSADGVECLGVMVHGKTGDECRSCRYFVLTLSDCLRSIDVRVFSSLTSSGDGIGR